MRCTIQTSEHYVQETDSEEPQVHEFRYESFLTMTASTVTKTAKANVGMGQVAIGQPSDVLTTVLGSCIGVAIYHARSRMGALAHVVLPASGGRPGHPGKFADTAIPYMVQRLFDEGVSSNDLVAKIAGGADMFGNGGPMQIGIRNLEAVEDALKQAGIEILGQHVGGRKGRRATFNCEDGSLAIEIAGIESEIL